MAIKPASSRGFLHYSNQESTDAGASKQIGSNLRLPLCIFISCRSGQHCADTQTALSIKFCLHQLINSCCEPQKTKLQSPCAGFMCLPCFFKSRKQIWDIHLVLLQKRVFHVPYFLGAVSQLVTASAKIRI